MASKILLLVLLVIVVVLFSISLPAVVDYVTFMKIQATAYIKIRFDYLFSIYVIFAVAVIARYVWIVRTAIRGGPSEESDPTKTGSGA